MLSQKLRTDAQCRAICGIADEAGPEAYAALLTAGNRDEILTAFATALSSAESTAFDFEFDLPSSAHPAKRVAISAHLETADPGSQQRFLRGTLRDITENAAAMRRVAELEVSARLMDATFSSIADLAYSFDREGRVLYANRRLLEVWGKSLDEARGKTVFDLEYPEPLASQIHAQLLEVIATGKPIRGETTFRDAAGVVDDHDYIFHPVFGENGEVIAVAGTSRLVTDKKLAEEALKKAKEDAETANRAKDHFLAVLSHELRTPLTPALMTVHVLETEPGLSAEVRDDLMLIRRNIELEIKLIDDLLDLSRVSNGKLRLHLEPLPLNDTVKNVCGICRSHFEEKSIQLNLTLDPNVGQVEGDSARLQQIIWNILKNAAKFTPRHGKVDISTATTPDGKYHVRIRDNGMGITPEKLPHIFTAFEQGDPGITLKFGGLGLGLAISKALAELHHGAIRVESAGAGYGALFTVELPALRSP